MKRKIVWFLINLYKIVFKHERYLFVTFWSLSETSVRRSLFISYSGSGHGSGTAWQEIGCVCGSVCSCFILVYRTSSLLLNMHGTCVNVLIILVNPILLKMCLAIIDIPEHFYRCRNSADDANILTITPPHCTLSLSVCNSAAFGLQLCHCACCCSITMEMSVTLTWPSHMTRTQWGRLSLMSLCLEAGPLLSQMTTSMSLFLSVCLSLCLSLSAPTSALACFISWLDGVVGDLGNL